MATDAPAKKVVRGHSPDGCYMVNCTKDGTNESRIYYYPKIQFGKEFSSSDVHDGVVTMTTTPPNEFIPWDEGFLTCMLITPPTHPLTPITPTRQYILTGTILWLLQTKTAIEFADHVTFFWNMPPGSVDKPAFTQVGTARNSAGANWNLYRGDGSVLFVDPADGFEARSIYFCC